MQQPSPDIIKRVKAELNELDKSPVEIDGIKLKPSQCYRFTFDPVNVLFNTNCPEALKQRVEEILLKYFPHESD